MLVSFLLLCAVIIFACVGFNRLSFRLGFPALLAFLFLGMLFGSDGIARIPFDDYAFADQISTVALLFIMFYGGFGTNWKAARPVAVQSILLSSLGTVLTAVLAGLFCHLALGMSLLEGLLCGAVLGSTDAASVFSILRSRKLALKDNTDSMLEVESGSNDPFAYMLTAVLLTAKESGITPASVASLLARQLLFGLAFGFGVGLAALWLFRRMRLGAGGFDTLFVVGVALVSYAAPAMLGGNGFLSVYITGILLGNGDIPNKPTLVPFFDGVTSMMQMVLFFLLGLLSFPSQMPAVLLPAWPSRCFCCWWPGRLRFFCCWPPSAAAWPSGCWSVLQACGAPPPSCLRLWWSSAPSPPTTTCSTSFFWWCCFPSWFRVRCCPCWRAS